MKYRFDYTTLKLIFKPELIETTENDLLCLIKPVQNNIVVRIKDYNKLKDSNAWDYDLYLVPDELSDFSIHSMSSVIEKLVPEFTLSGAFSKLPHYVIYSLQYNSGEVYKARPLVVAIVGESGSGKTALSLRLKELGIDNIISYTTRAIRLGETNGVEHWFVNEEDMPDKSKMLAYTYFGNNHYWAALEDIKNKKAVTYVIDEGGILDLYELKRDGLIDILWVQVERTNNTVEQERKDRDECREEAKKKLEQLHMHPHIHIENNYDSLEGFLAQEGSELKKYIRFLACIVD